MGSPKASLEQRLRDAARYGKSDLVKKLIKEGADVDAPESKDLWSPLHYAANGRKPGHYHAVMALLKAGANVNAQNAEGETPLHLAAQAGDKLMVTGLLEFDADINVEDKRGRTPFFMAVVGGHPNVAVLIKPATSVGNSGAGSPQFFGQTRHEINATHGIGESKRKLEKKARGEQELRDTAEEGDLVGVKEALELYPDIDVNALDDQGHTALYRAVFSGRADVVRFLIENDANPDKVDKIGQTALHVAAQRGFGKITRILIKSMEDVDVPDENGRTPLFIGAAEGHANVVKALIENSDANVNAENRKGETPLFAAAAGGHSDVVQVFLNAPTKRRKDLELDAPNADGCTALHAAGREGKVSIARAIIEAGGNPEARDKKGETPLFVAAYAGQTRMVETLLKDYKVNGNGANRHGESPLYIASLKGHVAVVSSLLKHGADTESSVTNGFTPLMAAAQEGRTGVISKLLAHNASIHAADNLGETPLLVAALEGYSSAVSLLIDNGADIFLPQNNGRTALHLASREGHVGVVKILLTASLRPAKVGKIVSPLHLSTDMRGETALHLAVRYGHIYVMDLLLVHDEKLAEEPGTDEGYEGDGLYGSLVEMSNRYGWTALHTAVDSQQREAVKKLINHQADVNVTDKFGDAPLHLAARRMDQRLVMDLLDVPGIRVGVANIEGRTPLHFAAACVRPDSMRELVNSGSDPFAQDKSSKRPYDVIGVDNVCNPAFAVGDDTKSLCRQHKTNTTLSMSGDMCPVARGNQFAIEEAKLLLKVSMDKAQNSTSDLNKPQQIWVQNPPAPFTQPEGPAVPSPSSTQGGNSVSLPLLAALIPMFAVFIFLVGAIYWLARRRRQKRIERESHDTHNRHGRHGRVNRRRTHNNVRRSRSRHREKKDNFSGKIGVGKHPMPLMSTSSAELHSSFDAYAMFPHGRPINASDTVVAPICPSDETDSDSSGTCGWTDSDQEPDVQHHNNGSGASTSGERPVEMNEVKVVRTISRSSSDGEVLERERRDGLGPLPSKQRVFRNRSLRGALASAAGRGNAFRAAQQYEAGQRAANSAPPKITSPFNEVRREEERVVQQQTPLPGRAVERSCELPPIPTRHSAGETEDTMQRQQSWS